ncbi:MAG: hypothetical protein KKB50_17140 [Planctomycetes bacterium]|nr:hypothetical protein [Planctomycetota bacterium]
MLSIALVVAALVGCRAVQLTGAKPRIVADERQAVELATWPPEAAIRSAALSEMEAADAPRMVAAVAQTVELDRPAAAAVLPEPSPTTMQDRQPAQVQKPTASTPHGGCVTTECHPGIKARAFAHGPVAVDACETCHKETDPARHTFELPHAGPELCGFCHALELKGAHVHQPVADGQCVQCHDPHGADNRLMLLGGAGAANCAECHGDVTAGMTVLHGPVAAGTCSACHRSHTSDSRTSSRYSRLNTTSQESRIKPISSMIHTA